ncbi:MAG TPA: toxin HicA [Blastocatellia bacterium]|nr:toxin HicA [Blastocatellia bacterium]
MKIDEVITELKRADGAMKFNRLKAICDHFFGAPRIRGSHHIYRTGTAHLVNIQNNKGQAKSYQVRQVRLALEARRQAEEKK